MKISKLILAAAAVVMMTALAGCGKSGGDSPEGPMPDNPSSKTFTITFVSNGGSAVAPQTVDEGELAVEPVAPTRTDYVFAGWFTDDNVFTDKWDFASRTVRADITLYAKWTAADVAPDPGAGVSINGVVWAKCNVDAFGTFAVAPENPGMFYQWNRPTAWPATGDVTGWDATNPSGDVWDAANDPCPAGWRVPTTAEQGTLLNTTNVSNEWTTLNAINGRRFTDITSGASIFLSAPGCRIYITGALLDAGYSGYYWSSSSASTIYSWGLDMSIGDMSRSNFNTSNGYSVRCVRSQ